MQSSASDFSVHDGQITYAMSIQCPSPLPYTFNSPTLAYIPLVSCQSIVSDWGPCDCSGLQWQLASLDASLPALTTQYQANSSLCPDEQLRSEAPENAEGFYTMAFSQPCSLPSSVCPVLPTLSMASLTVYSYPLPSWAPLALAEVSSLIVVPPADLELVLDVPSGPLNITGDGDYTLGFTVGAASAESHDESFHTLSSLPPSPSGAPSPVTSFPTYFNSFDSSDRSPLSLVSVLGRDAVALNMSGAIVRFGNCSQAGDLTGFWVCAQLMRPLTVAVLLTVSPSSYWSTYSIVDHQATNLIWTDVDLCLSSATGQLQVCAALLLATSQIPPQTNVSYSNQLTLTYAGGNSSASLLQLTVFVNGQAAPPAALWVSNTNIVQPLSAWISSPPVQASWALSSLVVNSDLSSLVRARYWNGVLNARQLALLDDLPAQLAAVAEYQGVVGIEDTALPITLALSPLPDASYGADTPLVIPPSYAGLDTNYSYQIVSLPRFGRLMAADLSLVLSPNTPLPSSLPPVVQYLPGLHLTGLPLDSFSFIGVDPTTGLSTLPASISVSLLPWLTPLIPGPHLPGPQPKNPGYNPRSVFAQGGSPVKSISTALISSHTDGSAYYMEQGCSVAFGPSQGSGESQPDNFFAYSSETCGTAGYCDMYPNFTVEASVRFAALTDVQQLWPTPSRPAIQVIWQLKVVNVDPPQRLVLAVCPASDAQQGFAVLCMALVNTTATGTASVVEHDANTLLWAPLLAASELDQWLHITVVAAAQTSTLTEYRLYRQGLLMAVGLGAPLLSAEHATLPVQWYVGTDLQSNSFTGWIDNVVAWQTARTAAQVQYSVRYLPSAADIAGPELWHWWPLQNDAFTGGGTSQQDWKTGDFNRLVYAGALQAPPPTMWSVCDPAQSDSAVWTTLLPISPVAGEWAQTLQAATETHSFVLSHAFSQLNDELLNPQPPVIFTASVPSFGFLWQVQLDSGNSGQLVREVVAYPGEALAASAATAATVSFVPARLPFGGSRDVVDYVDSLLAVDQLPADEWLLFYTPVTFPYGVLSDEALTPSDSFTLTATNPLIAAQQWSTLHASDAALQPSLTITLNTSVVGLARAEQPLSGLQSSMAVFTGQDPSYALLQTNATGYELVTQLSLPNVIVTLSLWLQFTGSSAAAVQAVLSCPDDSLFFGLEFGLLVLRVAGSISPVFSLPAPPLGVWTSFALLFPPLAAGSSSRIVYFLQNGDVLFVGPLPAGFPSSLQCETMLVGAVLSSVAGNSSAQFATTPSYSQVSPLNPSIRSLLQADIDALRIGFVASAQDASGSTALGSMITSSRILFDTPLSSQLDAFFDMLAPPLFVPSPPPAIATTAAGLYSPVPLPVSPQFAPSTSPVLTQAATLSLQGSEPFFLQFKMRFADSIVVNQLSSCSGGGAELLLYQVYDDGSEDGQPRLDQPIAANAAITNPRLRVWAVPVFGQDGSSLAVTCTIGYVATQGQEQQDPPPSLTVTFGLPPVLLYAQFSPSGSSIFVYLDAPTNGLSLQLLQGDGSCTPFLDNATLALLSAVGGQQQPECLWANASWLVVSPAPDSTVTVGSLLVFPAFQLQSNSPSSLVSGTVQVRAPASLIPPQVYQSGPSSAGLCGVSFFDAYASFGFRASAQLLSAEYLPFWSVDVNAAAQSVISPARLPYAFPADIGAVDAIHLLIRQPKYVRSCIDELEVYGQDWTLVSALDSELSDQQAASHSSDYFTVVNSELSRVNLAYGSSISDSCNDPYTSPFDRTANATLAVGHADLSLLVDGVYGTAKAWTACDEPQVWITVAFPDPIVVDHITIGNLEQCLPTNLMLFYSQDEVVSDASRSSRVSRQSRWDQHRQPRPQRAAQSQQQVRAGAADRSLGAGGLHSGAEYDWTPLQQLAIDATGPGAYVNWSLPLATNETFMTCNSMQLPPLAALDAQAMKLKPRTATNLFNNLTAQLPLMSVLLQLPTPAPVNGSNASQPVYELVVSMSLCGQYAQVGHWVDWDAVCLSWLQYEPMYNDNGTVIAVTTTLMNSSLPLDGFNVSLLSEEWGVCWNAWSGTAQDFGLPAVSLTLLSTYYVVQATLDVALPYPGLQAAADANLSLSLRNVFVLPPVVVYTSQSLYAGWNGSINASITDTFYSGCFWSLDYADSNSSILTPQLNAAQSYGCQSQMTTSLAFWSLRPGGSDYQPPAVPACASLNSVATVVSNYSELYFSPDSAVDGNIHSLWLTDNSTGHLSIVLQFSCLATVTSLQLGANWVVPPSITVLCAVWHESSAALQLEQVASVPSVDLLYANQLLALPGCVDAEYLILDFGQQDGCAIEGACLVTLLMIGSIAGDPAAACGPQLNATIGDFTTEQCVDGNLQNGAPLSPQYQQALIAGAAISFTADRQALKLSYSGQPMASAAPGLWQVVLNSSANSSVLQSQQQLFQDSEQVSFVQGPAGEAIAVDSDFLTFTPTSAPTPARPPWSSAGLWRSGCRRTARLSGACRWEAGSSSAAAGATSSTPPSRRR